MMAVASVSRPPVSSSSVCPARAGIVPSRARRALHTAIPRQFVADAMGTGQPRGLLQCERSRDHPEQGQSEGQSIDPLEFIARVITQIPDPRKHLVFYYGHYSNVARGLRNKSQAQATPEPVFPRDTPAQDPVLSSAQRAGLRRPWANHRGPFSPRKLLTMSPDVLLAMSPVAHILPVL